MKLGHIAGKQSAFLSLTLRIYDFLHAYGIATKLSQPIASDLRPLVDHQGTRVPPLHPH